MSRVKAAHISEVSLYYMNGKFVYLMPVGNTLRRQRLKSSNQLYKYKI